MGIPDNENIPDEKPKPKPGPRHDQSSAEQIIDRVMIVWSKMYVEGLSMLEIFTWNQDPAQMAKGWGYGYRHIHRLCQRAKRLGAELICKDHVDNVLQTLNEWSGLKKMSLKLGDTRGAIVCQVEIAKIRNVWSGKSLAGKAAKAKYFEWAHDSQRRAVVSFANLKEIQAKPPEGDVSILAEFT